jgi:hypothetical protein
MTWSLQLRVKGEGGVSARGRQINGKLYRVTLGEYPGLTLEAARASANTYLDQARRGVNPANALQAEATIGGLTLDRLAHAFIEE